MSAASRALIAIGVAGLALVVLNQASAPQLDPSLERAAVLASLLAVVLMVVGVLGERVLPATPPRVALQGREGVELLEGLPEGLGRELGWGSTLLLTATPAAVLVLQRGETTLLRRGLLGAEPFRPGPICERALQRQQAISLVNLGLYPGRAEFDTLLPGLPAVVVQPMGPQTVLVIGGWSPRCFDRSDLIWIEGWARRLTDEWGPAFGVPPDGAEGAGGPAAPGTG